MQSWSSQIYQYQDIHRNIYMYISKERGGERERERHRDKIIQLLKLIFLSLSLFLSLFLYLSLFLSLPLSLLPSLLLSLSLSPLSPRVYACMCMFVCSKSRWKCKGHSILLQSSLASPLPSALLSSSDRRSKSSLRTNLVRHLSLHIFIINVFLYISSFLSLSPYIYITCYIIRLYLSPLPSFIDVIIHMYIYTYCGCISQTICMLF